DRGTSRREALSMAALLPAAVLAAGIAPSAAAQTPQAEPKPAGPVTPALAAYIAGSGDAKFPEEHRDLARLHILDTLASIVACRDLEPALLARKYALAQSGTESRNAATIL